MTVAAMTRILREHSMRALALSLLWGAPLFAQAPGEPAANPNAPAAAFPPPAPAQVNPASPAAAPSGPSSYTCTPACRSGFVCVMNQCVSACNPACGEGELCTDQGRCVSACNPACAANERCTSQGQCIANAPPPPPPAPPQQYPQSQGQDWYYSGRAAPRDDQYGPPKREERSAGERYHDGFYLRMAVGVGYFLGRARPADVSDQLADDLEVGISGVSIPVEFAIGGTPTPGLVIGGGAYGIHLPSGTYKAGHGDKTLSESADYGSASLLAPFIDVYPNPRQGFHFQVAAGYAVANPGKSDKIVDTTLSGGGFGAMAGLGVEGWVGPQWGMGMLARVQYMSVELKDSDDKNKTDFIALTPSLLMSATFH